ncbi:phosphogluconate dehydrogenase C-terminal domain-containing protein [Vibrio sp. YIC-376]|uniref:phosphogluconate dehydrogenase C-terminal domain-containing protein n=1 Tax=Vibrio sp. YIC-376 TaxID=3136162 RepID=UPI00402ACBE7
MTTISLIGAGGKMGMRLSKNLKASDYKVNHVEISEAGRLRLKEILDIDAIGPQDQNAALQQSDVVILAVPDTLIGNIAAQVCEQLKSGTMVVILDAAAPFAGHLPEREDLVYFITHPCHPVIFNKELNEQALNDHFGGLHAKQSVVSTLLQGPDSAWDLGEDIAKTIYAPIKDSYRVTLHQMAMLEPGLSETVCATLLTAMRQAMDEVVEAGVPYDCARDFLLGHMNILAAVIFDEIEGQFSDACNKAIDNGLEKLLHPDWKKVFNKDELAHSIQLIT